MEYQIKCILEREWQDASCCDEYDCECQGKVSDCSGRCIAKTELKKLNDNICYDGVETTLNFNCKKLSPYVI